MKYRINRKTGDRISEIGIGSSYMFGAGMAEAVRALRCAVEGGINYFDLAAGDGTTFPIYGEALHGLSLLYGRMSHEHRHSGVFLPVQRRHAGES